MDKYVTLIWPKGNGVCVATLCLDNGMSFRQESQNALNSACTSLE